MSYKKIEWSEHYLFFAVLSKHWIRMPKKQWIVNEVRAKKMDTEYMDILTEE